MGGYIYCFQLLLFRQNSQNLTFPPNFRLNPKKPENSTDQMKEVMAIHEEVMPKMGKLSSLVEELKSKVDSTAQGQKYAKAMNDLQYANKAMIDWMGNFGDRFDSDEILNGKKLTPEKKELLKEEEKKVKALREKINSSIDKAEKLLNKE